MAVIALAPAGAALCAGPQALVCGGVALLALGIGALIVQSADDDAEENLSGAQTGDDVCSTCEPPPECQDLEDKAKKRRDKIQQRYQELRQDQHDLYRNHYYKWQAHPDYGSWAGHIEQLQGWQRGLRNILDESRSRGCPSIPGDVNRAATRDLPTQPRP